MERNNSSRCSHRSMEILSSEPPKEINIQLSDSDEDASTESLGNNSRTNSSHTLKSNRKKVSPLHRRSSPVHDSAQESQKSGARKDKNDPTKNEINNEKNYSVKEANSSAKTEKSETKNDENEKHKIEEGFEVIKFNDAKIKDLMRDIQDIRNETEVLRRENAKIFHVHKEKLGMKGNNLLEKLYFNDYPTLEAAEDALDPEGPIKLALDYAEEDIEKMTDEDIDKLVWSSKFFQTELEETESDINISYTESRDELDSISDTSSMITKSSRKSRPRGDIIKRNIRLVSNRDVLTPDERKRVEDILATIDENEEETRYNEINDDRMGKIDSLLKSKFSQFMPAIKYDATDSLEEYKAEIERIDLRLSDLTSENPAVHEFKSSTLLAIADVECDDEDENTLVSRNILPRDQINALISSFGYTRQDLRTANEGKKLSESELEKLLAQARAELEL